ncbi:hypothetical protein CSKR_100090 [Clonorchis sinensis]|uniref:Uncharacterized protein n=1 Tax=Clonorchis sinensis TaxID=79923 RepID=A0A419QCD3_CLOSI|nr:hypothetical protein CSKR_100090 [Clonorchis sinensis]
MLLDTVYRDESAGREKPTGAVSASTVKARTSGTKCPSYWVRCEIHSAPCTTHKSTQTAHNSKQTQVTDCGLGES